MEWGEANLALLFSWLAARDDSNFLHQPLPPHNAHFLPNPQGAARASAIMHQDRPHERIVRWIERVGVLGTDFLRPPTRDVGLLAAFAIDAVAVLVAFVIAVLVAFCCLARCAWRCCCGVSTTGTKAKVA